MSITKPEIHVDTPAKMIIEQIRPFFDKSLDLYHATVRPRADQDCNDGMLFRVKTFIVLEESNTPLYTKSIVVDEKHMTWIDELGIHIWDSPKILELVQMIHGLSYLKIRIDIDGYLEETNVVTRWYPDSMSLELDETYMEKMQSDTE